MADSAFNLHSLLPQRGPAQVGQFTSQATGEAMQPQSKPAVTTPVTARTAMNAAANFAIRDCSASILSLMRAGAPLKRLSSASNTAVAFGITTAPRQRPRSG